MLYTMGKTYGFTTHAKDEVIIVTNVLLKDKNAITST